MLRRIIAAGELLKSFICRLPLYLYVVPVSVVLELDYLSNYKCKFDSRLLVQQNKLVLLLYIYY